MQVTVIGGCFIALGIFFAIWRREWYPGLLAASAPFVATAAITFGSGSVPPFYVLAIGAIALTVWRGLRGRWPNRRLTLLMGVFFAVALLPTVVAPFIFAGTPVLDPRAGIDDQVLNPTPLAFTALRS